MTPQETPLSPFLIPYGADSNAFRHRGAKSDGIDPIMVPAAVVASMHSDAERVPVAELGIGIQILFDALREAAR